VPAPKVDEIVKVLKHISAEERVPLPDKLANTIAVESGRNMRRAIMIF